MRLVRIGNTSATVVEAGGAKVLFSYATPVAAQVYGQGWFYTLAHHSVTTSRHINKFLPMSRANATGKPQEWFDNLLEVKVNTP